MFILVYHKVASIMPGDLISLGDDPDNFDALFEVIASDAPNSELEDSPVSIRLTLETDWRVYSPSEELLVLEWAEEE